MILHCTPPYGVYTPNPALGYLKGFLQSKGVAVKNVYWNVILEKRIAEFQGSLADSVDMKVFPELTKLYLSRHLLTTAEQVTPLDLVYKSVYTKKEIQERVASIKDDIDQYIKRNNLHKTDIAGFTLKFFQWPMSCYIIGRLKEMNPDIHIVVGGITSKSQGMTFMNMLSQADFALYGEGEYSLFSLIEALKEGTLCTVPHLIYRENNSIVSTDCTLAYKDLDLYPFPDYSDYFDIVKKVKSEHPILIPVLGSRSCAWNKCKFCVLNAGYHYRARSPESIVKEIEYQSKKYDVYDFVFIDTEVASNMKRFKTLLKLLRELSSQGNYRFYADVSPVFITAETAYDMQRASFKQIQIGFEAVTDSLLKKMQKKHQFAHNIQALKLGSRYQIKVSGLNILREIPTETKDDITESCMNVKFLRFFPGKRFIDPGYLKLFKGAPFYRDVPAGERELWREDPYWAEIAPTHLVDEGDRFELFGFYRGCRNPQWDIFESLLTLYVDHDCSYTWIEYPEGSFVEEKGIKCCEYTFDRDETDLLVFCNSIKMFSDIKKKFFHVDEKKLLNILCTLKEYGVVYYNKNLTSIISLLEADERITLTLLKK
jgi:radical SAM superfamily enzyme YgiQ (UPF0313 family)